MSLRIVRVLSGCAILFGVWARLFDFGHTPPGLNPDEASIGYEAWSLLNFGVDRNGFSWPVHFVSWGSGQNVLYAYLTIPFVVHDLTPFTIRLPMLLTAIGSLPLVWVSGQKLFGEKAAWAATTAVALSPWHIMSSRWALESNLLPFVFLCGYTCLAISRDAQSRHVWLAGACVFFGLALYAYGSAYLSVPIFLVMALCLFVADGGYSRSQAITGLAFFSITAMPIAIFVGINFLKWHTVSVFGISIPLLPSVPRFESQIAAGPLVHIGQFWRLLLSQRDRFVYNTTDPYGVLYSSIFFGLGVWVAVVSSVLVVQKKWPSKRGLVPMWLLACAPTGFVQEPNINRINLLLMGLVIAAGLALAILDERMRGSLIVGIIALLGMSCLFGRAYFGSQRDKIGIAFYDGLLQSLEFVQARARASDMVCVTDKVNMPYIYALFSERTDPRQYGRTVRYADDTAAFREVLSFGRYKFDLEKCDFVRARFAIAVTGEEVGGALRKVGAFSTFAVYARP